MPRRLVLLASLALGACVQQTDDESGSTGGESDAESSSTGAGESEGGELDPCRAPESAEVIDAKLELDALPELESGTPVDGRFSYSMPCTLDALSLEAGSLRLEVGCEHLDVGAVALAFETHAEQLPSGLSLGDSLELELMVFPVEERPPAGEVLVARYQRVALSDASGLVFGLVAGVGATFVELDPITASLETECSEYGKDDELAATYMVRLGTERVELGVGEQGVIGDDPSWSVRVFQAEIHGCCAGNEGSLVALRR